MKPVDGSKACNIPAAMVYYRYSLKIAKLFLFLIYISFIPRVANILQ